MDKQQRQLQLSQTRDGQLQVLRANGDPDDNEPMYEYRNDGEDDDRASLEDSMTHAALPSFFIGLYFLVWRVCFILMS